MKRLPTILIAVLFWLAPLVGSPCANAKLPDRLEKLVRQRIIPVYHSGDTDAAAKLALGLIDKLDATELAEADELLSAEEVPSAGEMVLDTRLKSVLHRNTKSSNVQPREAAATMPVLYARINKLIVDVEAAEYYREELPEYETLKDFEDVFWEIHVATNRLQNAVRMSRYGDSVTSKALADKRGGLSDIQIERLNLDFELFLTELKQIATELNEVKAELRIRSLIKAADILRNSDDFKARLLASYTVGFAGEQVLSFLRSEEVKKFTRPMLRQENLLSTVQNYVTLAKESSGELSHKAQLLYMGMHWWMRGRYGEGPEGMGLLKAVVPRNGERNRGNNRLGNRAVNGANGGGIAQFALFMPMKPPKPTMPAAYGYNVPKFDRRHHYIWMYEYRRLTTRNTSVVKNSNREVTSKTQLSQFY